MRALNHLPAKMIQRIGNADESTKESVFMLRFKFQVVATVVLLLVSFAAVSAQTIKGFVVGTVEDQNGASIPNAAVKITNLQTGVSRDTVADNSGSYRLDAVDPGTYMLEASGQGFKTAKVDKVEV